MKREHIHMPPGFEAAEVKLDVLEDSLDKLLEGTERFRYDADMIGLVADITASLICVHQVLIQELRQVIDGSDV